MDNVSFVHVFDGFAYLSHVVDDFCFGHCVSFGSDAFKQFATRQAEICMKSVNSQVQDGNYFIRIEGNFEETYNSKIRTISSSSSNAS